MLFGLINLMNSVAFAKVIYSFVLTYSFFFITATGERDAWEKDVLNQIASV